MALIFQSIFPDNHPDKDVRRVEEKFIAYDIGTDIKAESYLLIMQTKSSLSATYNGKEINSRSERYKNVRLPNAVLYSIYRTYLTTLLLTTSTYTLKKKVF
jgi:hypothetical protein